jgi:hypothetical protein
MVNGFNIGPPPGRQSPRGEGWLSSGHSPLFSGANVQTTTFTTGNGGTTRLTIATGPISMPPLGGRSPGGVAGGTDFQSYANPSIPPFRRFGPQVTMVTFRINTNERPRVFGNILNDDGPPRAGRDDADFGGFPRGGITASLHEILSLLTNPGGGAHGDAVYSQEALDRIITTLMEQNPQSNAAPPASEDALSRLERKKVDDKMLEPEGRVECTICIDEMKKGEDVVILPCKHWFHEQCVVMWLKEHNTCPICRTPMETNPNNISQQGEDSSNSGGGGPRFPFPFAGAPSGSGNYQASTSFDGRSGGDSRTHHTGRTPYYRTSSQPTSARLADVIHNLSRAEVGRQSQSSGRAPSGPPDPSRPPPRPRRDSFSPPNPGTHASAHGASRTRRRSPSPNRRRSVLGSWHSDREPDRERSEPPSGTGSRGPFGWIRDQFSSNREHRRS